MFEDPLYAVVHRPSVSFLLTTPFFSGILSLCSLQDMKDVSVSSQQQYHVTDESGILATTYAYIREVLGSNSTCGHLLS
jgi:hypothetical protein